jgi:high-affinity Fe2+/Pb2+ permease
VNPDGSYPLLHEKGLIGSSLESLIGYHADPSLTMIIAYLGYWIIIGIFVYRTYKVPAEVKYGSRYPQD